MLGLLFAAFESITGRAKGPMEKSQGEMKEDVNTYVKAERERAKDNVKGTSEANEVP